MRFAERPIRAFLRKRLGISVADYSDDLEDALPVQLDGLSEWSVGQRLLDARLAGAERRGAILAEIARGTLPPGQLGRPVIDKIEPVVDEIVAQAPPGTGGSLDVRLALPDGRTLSGTVAGVVGDVLRTVTYSRVNPRHRIAAWVRLLAVQAAHPDREFEAVTVGRDREGGVRVVRAAGLDAALALDHLIGPLELYDRGMREPAPLVLPDLGGVRGRREPAPGLGVGAGSRARTPSPSTSWSSAACRSRRSRSAAARPDERWDPDETRRFAQWARRLWDPVLEHERR